MKVLLLHPDRDFDPEADLPGNAADLRQDLELDRLLDVMARNDEFLFGVCEHALLNGLRDPAQIRYRQEALRDSLTQIDTVIGMYNIVFEALAEERKHWLYRSSMYRPPANRLIDRSISLLSLFLDALVRVRDLAAAHRAEFHSPAYLHLFDTLSTELSDTYVDTAREHLSRLRFAHGTHFSLRLEKGCGSTDYILRRANSTGWLDRLGQLATRDADSYTFRIPDRDLTGLDALSELRGRAIMEVAETLNRSTEHVTAFLRQLRVELGFYIGCFHLHRELHAKHEPLCYPTVADIGAHTMTCRGLYDPCLALSVDAPVVGNDVDADAKTLIMVTGANQGGKSTFLRSAGIAQLMMQAGMFVPATQFRANVRDGVYTHFKREEDQTMTHGKFDEELVRMSELIDHMSGDALLLCNESFASTNEREGSAIARDVIGALTDAGMKIYYVTHMYDLASSLHARGDDEHLFLRAERRDDGTRSFRILAAPPLPTSFGDDVYRRIFGAELDAEQSPIAAFASVRKDDPCVWHY
ncbi:DNA mismatch repair protein [Nocardia nova]|uniref:MutS-related protein n=1 Tax=Nocardia nova TaxID=37330 RepID=UPI00378BE718